MAANSLSISCKVFYAVFFRASIPRYPGQALFIHLFDVLVPLSFLTSSSASNAYVVIGEIHDLYIQIMNFTFWEFISLYYVPHTYNYSCCLGALPDQHSEKIYTKILKTWHIFFDFIIYASSGFSGRYKIFRFSYRDPHIFWRTLWRRRLLFLKCALQCSRSRWFWFLLSWEGISFQPFLWCPIWFAP